MKSMLKFLVCVMPMMACCTLVLLGRAGDAALNIMADWIENAPK